MTTKARPARYVRSMKKRPRHSPSSLSLPSSCIRQDIQPPFDHILAKNPHRALTSPEFHKHGSRSTSTISTKNTKKTFIRSKPEINLAHLSTSSTHDSSQHRKTTPPDIQENTAANLLRTLTPRRHPLSKMKGSRKPLISST